MIGYEELRAMYHATAERFNEEGEAAYYAEALRAGVEPGAVLIIGDDHVESTVVGRDPATAFVMGMIFAFSVVNREEADRVAD